MSAPAAAGFLQSPLPHCFAATPPLAGSPHRWVTGLPQWRWPGKSPESAVAATRAVPGGTKAPLSAQAEPGDCQTTLLKPARRECKGSHGAGVSAPPASVSLLPQAGRGLISLPRCCNPCSPWSTPAVSSPACGLQSRGSQPSQDTHPDTGQLLRNYFYAYIPSLASA